MPEIPASSDDPLHTLYSNHHLWLLRWLRHKLGCPHHAADLAQDTFLRVLRSGSVPGAEQSRAYLTQIAKGLMIDQHRRLKLEHAYQEALSQLPEPEVPSPETRLIIIETLLRIDAALDALPKKVRQAFLLSQLDGLKYAEIARRLGVSVSSVQKYMLRALEACYVAEYGA